MRKNKSIIVYVRTHVLSSAGKKAKRKGTKILTKSRRTRMNMSQASLILDVGNMMQLGFVFI